MRISFDEINRKDFQVQERVLDGFGKVFLITPSFDKHRWSDDELHLRSLLCDPDGKIISSGFPKFRNHGESPSHDLLTAKAVKNGCAWFPEKMDGSLVIRSVINGKVHFRTRGSHTLGEGFAEPILRLVQEKYPRLLDPTLDTRFSILFEYTSPENLVVIEYPEARLTALGLMDLESFPPEFVSSPDVVQALENDYGTPGVRFHNLEGDLNQVIDQVKTWKGVEGIVVWSFLNEGMLHLSKIKAAEYIRIHSLKFQLSDEKVRQLCWYKDIATLDQLRDEFYRLGVDWEAISFIRPIFEAYIARRNEITSKVNSFIDSIDKEGVADLPNRKEKALKLQEMSRGNSELFNLGIQYVLGEKNVQHFIDAMVLEISIKRIKSYRQEAADLSSYVESKA